MNKYNAPHKKTFIILLAVLVIMFAAGMIVRTALASVPGGPLTVVIVGSLQDELGCPGDWQPDCAASALYYDAVNGVWQGSFSNILPGNYEYKVALNNSWDENYGQNAQPSGANISITIPEAGTVKFYYDASTHWVTSDRNQVIASVPGSFLTELGCTSDWQPDCLLSWLRNPDGDHIYGFTTEQLPAGNYEAKVALNEKWDINYGAGGIQNGANIPFTVSNDCEATSFEYDSTTHVLDIQPAPAASQPSSVTIAGTFQSELGCPGDWQPDCVATHLVFDSQDGIWQGTWTVPAGNWEYKVVLDESLTENYGQNATFNGTNIPLNVSMPATIKFYYSHATHWVTDNYTKPIFTAPGSFQSELGCSGDTPDWAPDCLRSWLQDPDGDGNYSFSTAKLPPGNYEVKVAVNEDWSENYGAGGEQNGANISFSVPEVCASMSFNMVGTTHFLTVQTTDITAQPGLSIEAQVNGQNADISPGLVVKAGSSLVWKYEVINSGALPLTGISVTDDQGLVVTCPKTSLQAGEFMTCTASATTAQPGPHMHVATISGNPSTGSDITASDPAYYYGSGAFVSIKTMINGSEAEPGFFAHVGDLLQFSYVVTDSGDSALTSIVVTDSKGLTVTCPKTTLDPSESMTCTASGTALADYNTHTGSVSANPPSGPAVTASDPVTYLGSNPSHFSISIETLLNGNEADTAPGISTKTGSTLAVNYQVTNTGIIDLVNIAVTDDQGLTVTCPYTTLGPASVMACTAQATALAGQNIHVGSVSAALLVPSAPITASDPAYYYGLSDVVPPVVEVTGVTEGATYILGTGPTAGCSTTDDGSGVAAEAALSLSGGNSLGVGSFTATCSGAVDNAGNSASPVSGHYNVTFLFTGFSSPVDNPNVMNIAKAGQAIPLKWRITDANGNPISNLTSVTVTATSLSCTAGTTTDQIEEYATGRSDLQNLGDGYYQWNWKTPTSYASSCKTMKLDLGEGLFHTALFQFKK